MKKPEIIIVDDHMIFRQGLKSLITSENIALVIGEASNGKEFLELISHLRPDLVLMDIDMPHMNGMEATQKALDLIPDLKIIAFTMFGDEEYYYKMIDLGVKGFILKSSGINELEKAISEVMMGESYFSNEVLRKIISNLGRKNNNKTNENANLTTRELEVLQQICLGLNNDEIAQKLFISPKTIKSHRSNLLEKTGCKNTPALILLAIKNKWVEV
ncbi:MAG TPA: response regulator transcription factor [Prolixibacteraceae bacterium]|nr:response regulator transcription factor [Prolixibacteraceae bacterium]